MIHLEKEVIHTQRPSYHKIILCTIIKKNIKLIVVTWSHVYDIGMGGDPFPTDHAHHKIRMGLCHRNSSYMEGDGLGGGGGQGRERERQDGEEGEK